MALTSCIKLNIAEKLKDKDYRKRFFRGQAQDFIAMSIRQLRKKRKKNQIDLADECDMKQSAISRIEQADYSGWSFSTLLRVADALDARLRVSFDLTEDVIDSYRVKEAVITQETVQLAQEGAYDKVINIKDRISTKSDVKGSKKDLTEFTKENQAMQYATQSC